jgi:hypothetical protein
MPLQDPLPGVTPPAVPTAMGLLPRRGCVCPSQPYTGGLWHAPVFLSRPSADYRPPSPMFATLCQTSMSPRPKEAIDYVLRRG